MKTTEESGVPAIGSASLVKKAKRGPKIRMSRKAANPKSGLHHILYTCPNCESEYEEVSMVFLREYLCAACSVRMRVKTTKVD